MGGTAGLGLKAGQPWVWYPSHMANRARDLESQALELPAEERARLAERLLASLEALADPEAESLWLEESERRLTELDSGATAGVRAEEVFRKSRSALR